MKQISLYFAGAWAGTCSSREADLGVTKKLCSFLYPDQLESWLTVAKDVPGKIIIDSGAFSAWNKGKEVDFDAYIEYCRKTLNDPRGENKTIRCVNLDVIPGKKGETKKLTSSVKKEDKDLITYAAKTGFDNMMYFKKNGITPIHVFHQGEDFKWLDKMVEQTDYIGISPANDVHQNQKQAWIDKTFSYIERNNIKVDTHGFAVWSPTVVLNYPWTSCDAATWRLVAAYGGIYYPVGGFANPDFSQNPLVLACSERRLREDMVPFGKEFVQLLKDDGYDIVEVKNKWEVRSEINVRYFLEFEKWVNRKKATMEFKPTNSFNLRG
jgi:hypothetical protein